jgi:hypothetical protein
MREGNKINDGGNRQTSLPFNDKSGKIGGGKHIIRENKISNKEEAEDDSKLRLEVGEKTSDDKIIALGKMEE